MDEFEKNKNWLSTYLSLSEYDLLREHTQNPSVWDLDENKNKLTTILSNITPTETEITLYSGAEIPIDKIRFNEPLGLPYFTSSYDRSVAEHYSKMQNPTDACLFILTVPPGSRIICLDNISIHGDKEREVLLSRMGKLCITKVLNTSEETGFITIYATYIGKY